MSKNIRSGELHQKLADQINKCAPRIAVCNTCPVRSDCTRIWDSISRKMTINEHSYQFYSEKLTELRNKRDSILRSKE